MKSNKTNKLCITIQASILLATGCARVAIEGGEKPIHIVMDVNVKVARELDNFFDFEDQHPAGSQPTTSATAPAATKP